MMLSAVLVPGGIELLVILLVAIMLFGVPLVLIVGGLFLYRRVDSGEEDDARIERLEREVAELRRQQEGRGEREDDREP